MVRKDGSERVVVDDGDGMRQRKVNSHICVAARLKKKRKEKRTRTGERCILI